jgi:peptidoglycan L-alanyl-D-glutamate endopeptidase CwlK
MDLKLVQAQLNKKGYGPLIVDGIPGTNTSNAIKKFQADKHLTVDGIIGQNTINALFEVQIEAPKVELDNISLQRIKLLHPKLRAEATQILYETTKALTGRAACRYTFTLRTFKEQQDLYNLGRSVVNPDGRSSRKPMGNVVTNAQQGQSLHNFGVAIDFAFVIDGREASWDSRKDWDNDGISDWMEVVSLFKKYGWEWGGSWKTFLDLPHFQKTFGYGWRDLLKKHNAKDFIPGTEYVNL